MLADRRAVVPSRPSRKERGLEGAHTIEGEPGVKHLTGPPAYWLFISGKTNLCQTMECEKSNSRVHGRIQAYRFETCGSANHSENPGAYLV